MSKRKLNIIFRAVDEVSSYFDAMARSGERALEVFGDIGTSADRALSLASQTATDTARSLDDTADSAADTARSLDDTADSADGAAEGVREFGEQSEQAGGQSEEFGRRSGDAVKSLKEIIASAGIVKAVKEIGEAFVECAKDSIEFESAITGVYKTVDGTDEQLAAISAEVRHLSTEIPASTTEIAGVAEAAGQLGIATDDIMAFTEVMINLGESTNLSADEAASSLAKFANITGTSAEDYEELGSTIVALGNNFATTEADIVAMATRMASAGTLAGMSETDILALSSSLSSIGVEADAGGSAMSSLMSQMQLAVETGSDQLENFASVAGYSASDFQQKWGEDAAGALYAFIAGLNDTERNGASATAILDEMGITEVRLSNAVKGLASNSDILNNALTFSADAWDENTALATEAETRYGTLESKLAMTENAANNLSTAVGDVFNPVIADGSELLTDMFNGLTAFVEENPEVVAAVTAVAVGVGAVTLGVVGFTFATQTAIPAVKSFGLTLNTALGPVGWIAAGITAAVVAVTAFVAILSSQNDEYEEMTASSRDTYDQLQNLNAEYENACATYGETSEEALRLRYELDDLNASFEANRMTVEEFAGQSSALVESHNELAQSYAENTAAIREEEVGSLALIQKLEELANSTEQTMETQMKMESIVGTLNETYPDLALSVEDVTQNTDAMVESLKKAAEEQAKQEQYQESYDTYVQLIGERARLEEQIAAAEKNISLEQEKMSNMSGWDHFWTGGEWDDLEAYETALADLETALEENIQMQQQCESAMKEYADATAEAAEETKSFDEVLSTAFGSVQAEIDELCAAYDAAYDAAHEAISGSMGLFENMSMNGIENNVRGAFGVFEEVEIAAEKSADELVKILDSQTQAYSDYAKNLADASASGIAEGLLESLSDGSEDSIGYLGAVVSHIQELGEGTAEAKAYVDELNSAWANNQSAQDYFDTASNSADEFVESLKSQSEYITQYVDNLQKAGQIGLDEGLIASLSDGSQESAAQLQAILDKVGELGESSSEARSFVDDMNTAFQDVEQAKDEFSTTVAEMEVNFDETMADIEGRLAESIGEMNMEVDAAAAAAATMTAYTKAIKDGTESAVEAAVSAGAEVANALNISSVGSPPVTVAGHASGTVSAEDIFVAGENGPELIIGAGGSTVFPAAETSRILSAIEQNPIETAVSPAQYPEESGGTESSGGKKITLEINGGGSIGVPSGTDKNSVLQILIENIKPVLMGILDEEILEEGELAYEY